MTIDQRIVYNPAHIQRFQEVVLDFDKVNTIGPAFADEIFRVWQHEHPEVKLIPLNTSREVSQAILRALENG